MNKSTEFINGMEVALDSDVCTQSDECLFNAEGVFGRAADGHPNVIKADGAVSDNRTEEEFVLVPPEHQEAVINAKDFCPSRAILIRALNQ